MFNERDILDHLSHPLQSEIAMLKCRDVLKALRVHDDNLARKIALSLKRVVFVSGDCVLHEGDYGRGMYFITSGTVEIFVRGIDQPMTTLGKHSFFGEMSLLEPGGKVTASTVVSGYMEGWQLTRESFHELLAQFPEFREYIVNVARKRRGRAVQSSDGGSQEEDAAGGAGGRGGAAAQRVSVGDDDAGAALVEMPLAKRKLLRNARRESRRGSMFMSKSSSREAMGTIKQEQHRTHDHKVSHTKASPGLRRGSRASIGSKYDVEAEDTPQPAPKVSKSVRIMDDFAA